MRLTRSQGACVVLILTEDSIMKKAMFITNLMVATALNGCFAMDVSRFSGSNPPGTTAHVSHDACRDREGNTPLILAAKSGDIDNVNALLNMGFDINERNYRGRTSLIEASENGHKNVVRLLRNNGADPDLKDKDGFTALIHAIQQKNTDIVNELIGYANVNVRDHENNTPLIWAARMNHYAAARLLLQKYSLMPSSIDIDAKNKLGENAIDCARRYSAGPLIEFLYHVQFFKKKLG